MSKVARVVSIVVLLGVILAAGAAGSLAAEGEWPTVKLPSDFRGPGFYLNWLKILACWLVFLCWVKTTDWVSIDAFEMKTMNFLRWNPIVFGTFTGAFVLVWLLPSFWIGFPLLLVAYIAPLLTYIVQRNAKVGNDERVLTPEHIRHWLSVNLNKVGMKVQLEKKVSTSPVELAAEGGPDERTDRARHLMARQSPGLRAAEDIIADGMAGRASAIMLDYSQQGATMRAMIDGVWIPRDTKPRELADPALHALKLICGLKPNDHQSRQEGTFAATYKSVHYFSTFAAQGVASGERVVMQFEDKKIPFKTLDDLGMRTKLQEQLSGLLGAQAGFVLLSAIPEGGLRSSTDVILRSLDRFTREFVAVEEERSRYPEVENIPVTTYKAADGQSPVDVLPSLFRKEPNVAVVRDLVDAKTVSMLCQELAKNRLLIGTTRAMDCADALLRILALGVPQAEFAKAVSGVVCQRLVRKLCDACKEAYAPTAEILAQLGIPEGRVKAFYRPPQPRPDAPKEPCATCGAIGYFGRTAIFEVLSVGDAVRKVLAANPRLDLLRKAAREDGMTSLQEEGALLVVKGTTSLPELIRVLKQ
jgi:type II secretory ATPase GspE/PulE/Tfp pilus assembly ATPase PilB-like protein